VLVLVQCERCYVALTIDFFLGLHLLVYPKVCVLIFLSSNKLGFAFPEEYECTCVVYKLSCAVPCRVVCVVVCVCRLHYP
jgi:hypothetical protein